MIFTGYEFDVERISSSLAFVTLTLFNVMRFPLIVLPKALRALSGEPVCLSDMLLCCASFDCGGGASLLVSVRSLNPDHICWECGFLCAQDA
jgi:hypothetical protein